MMIGEQAQDNVSLMKRVMAEGHEIGNHTWTHPDISEISPGQVQLQLNLTERLFGSKLGVKPLFSGLPTRSIRSRIPTTRQRPPI
jgi:peptidoglycan/xylan/chitin deacetylase (PgdA/CDA1 family)